MGALVGYFLSKYFGVDFVNWETPALSIERYVEQRSAQLDIPLDGASKAGFIDSLISSKLRLFDPHARSGRKIEGPPVVY